MGFGRPVGSFSNVQAPGVSLGAGGVLHATERLSLHADVDFSALAETIDRTGPFPLQHTGQQVWQYVGGLGYRVTPGHSPYLLHTYVGAGMAHRTQHGEGTNALDLAGGMRFGRTVSRHAEIALRTIVHRIGSTEERPRVVHQLQVVASWRS